jgi:hypothetical protein
MGTIPPFRYIWEIIMGPNKKVQPTTNRKGRDQLPLVRPPGVDADWDVKIQRAREAWEAGKRLRKDQPALPPVSYAS